MHTFERKVLRFIREHSLLAPRDVVLVAFSGGPDSTALAEALHRLRSLLDVELVLFHLNHKLRGEESERDEAFCVQWAQERNLPIVVERRDVASFHASSRLSLEEAARTIRYEAFRECAARCGASSIALGHTLDDQAETVLMNILRGTGLSGLCGMKPKDGPYIRPLLGVWRSEVLEFLKGEGIPFVEDSSNFDPTFLRNRIRLEVLPLLRELNPRVLEALVRLSLNAQEVMHSREEPEIPIVRQNGVTGIALDELILLPPEERPQAIRKFLREVRGTLWDITRGQVMDILRLVERRKGEVTLPGKVRVWVHGGYLWASSSPLPLVNMPSWNFPLDLPGAHAFPDLGLTLEARFEPLPQDRGLSWQVALDFERCLFPFALRNFREGDRMMVEGKEWKLKELFDERGIPWEWRRAIPILCDAEKILWIPGVALDERVRVQENSKRILHVAIRRYKG
ncbi:MAG: tRNA lysidine(34) synthetase TilS [Candidatus Caldatribacterium sp.]|nr:tRNA lysidine(34) synthetase TilS [Candidatus Caldatribacterium sp.]